MALFTALLILFFVSNAMCKDKGEAPDRRETLVVDGKVVEEDGSMLDTICRERNRMLFIIAVTFLVVSVLKQSIGRAEQVKRRPRRKPKAE